MLTEQEARSFYDEFIAELTNRGAEDLVKDIQATVMQGTFRDEHAKRKEKGIYQIPLSPKEALITALRMFMASLEPSLQIEESRKRLISGDAETALGFTWAFDKLEPTDKFAREILLPSQEDVYRPLQEVPSLDEQDLDGLRVSLERLQHIIDELLDEGE